MGPTQLSQKKHACVTILKQGRLRSSKAHSTLTHIVVFTSMYRFYPALSDTRTCKRCNSACALFGQIDEETSWFGWCTLCNGTWHNRRAESMLLAVNREFKRYSLAALTGNNATALRTFTFLQTNIDCVKHSIQLRHHLNIQVLMWICCPLAWFYVRVDDLGPYLAAEAERLQHPVLRTLQETFILSKTFKQKCAFHAQYLTDCSKDHYHVHCCMRYVRTSGPGQPTAASRTKG